MNAEKNYKSVRVYVYILLFFPNQEDLLMFDPTAVVNEVS